MTNILKYANCATNRKQKAHRVIQPFGISSLYAII